MDKQIKELNKRITILNKKLNKIELTKKKIADEEADAKKELLTLTKLQNKLIDMQNELDQAIPKKIKNVSNQSNDHINNDDPIY
ncbi:hypothetical protein B5E92_11545 [Erysipelatoclostridium sp. An15]|uniref:hypothetical protein n=1 Tax=Erysipelatoclostridium sp. An15 TaxID=1965566 RepID=UPI000B37960F|nr:hypothetical protein [Erysipelatoclostridium sp. An15]OUQ06066.1 hypothetical protein B5E92_11545 [Erysipelatoclostridium sp. An15]